METFKPILGAGAEGCPGRRDMKGGILEGEQELGRHGRGGTGGASVLI